MSMDRLPDELLLLIFRHIDDFREMLKLELVCRRWHKIMRNHGWKHIRQVVNRANCRCRRNQNRLGHLTLLPDKWVMPVGEHCGNNLVDCSLYRVVIDSKLMRLIARNLPALRHLKFHRCRLIKLKANVLDPFRQFCSRLRSLTFFDAEYFPHLVHNLLRYFPRLRHIGFDFFHRDDNDANDICRHFSTYLRSLYLNCRDYAISDLEQMLARMRTDSPDLRALYLNAGFMEWELLRISELKNLRFLRMGPIDNPDWLTSCLASLPHLRALQLWSDTQRLPGVFRSSTFRGLVHLRLSLFAEPSANYELIGLLATFAPQLRSFNLDIVYYEEEEDDSEPSLELAQQIGCQLLKIAHNGNLEHLHLPCASFAIADIDQLVRLCPNLHSFCARMPSPMKPLSEIAELQRLVAHQWRAGTRKHLPLRIWMLGEHAQAMSAIWHDPFLSVRPVDFSFVPLDPVVDQLFRKEIFNGIDDGGTPSFVTECYSESHSDCYAQNVPKKDLVIF